MRLSLLGIGKVFLSPFFSSAIGELLATHVSDQGGCSCVQDISVTSCEENMMLWEVSGTLVKFIILGMHHRVILSRVIYFLLSTLASLSLLLSLLFLSLLHDSSFCLLFLSLIHKLYSPSVFGSSINLIVRQGARKFKN